MATTPRPVAPPPESAAPNAPDPGLPLHDSGTVNDPWVGRLAASEGMFVTDDRQRIVAWSSAAQRLLGFSPEEAVGRTCYQVVMGREPDGHPVCGRNCSVTRNARRLRGTAAYDVVAHSRDGATKCLSNSVLVIEGPEGAFHVVHLLRETPMAQPVMRRLEVAAPSDAEPLVETLTRRELEVLRLLAQGATIDEIAESLTISVLTARNHTASIARKLGAHSRLETVLLAMRHGLV
jgi:PAS domain S-box-containing protein